MAIQEKIVLEQVLRELRTEKELSRLNWQRLRRIFGERFLSAWDLVVNHRIKKYVFRPSEREVWIAIGNTGEYLIYPQAGYCSCSDFYFRVLDEEVAFCYHLIAQKLAEALGYFDLIPEEDEVYRELMGIWEAYIIED
jgi:predicted nucleic acid-binding Zn finger protein